MTQMITFYYFTHEVLAHGYLEQIYNHPRLVSLAKQIRLVICVATSSVLSSLMPCKFLLGLPERMQKQRLSNVRRVLA